MASKRELRGLLLRQAKRKQVVTCLLGFKDGVWWECEVMAISVPPQPKGKGSLMDWSQLRLDLKVVGKPKTGEGVR